MVSQFCRRSEVTPTLHCRATAAGLVLTIRLKPPEVLQRRRLRTRSTKIKSHAFSSFALACHNAAAQGLLIKYRRWLGKVEHIAYESVHLNILAHNRIQCSEVARALLHIGRSV